MYHRNISSIEDCTKFLSHSTRIKIVFHNKKLPDIAIKFEKEGKEAFLLLFQKSLLKKSWEAIEKSENDKKYVMKENNTNSFSASNAGVSGIIRRQEKQLLSIDNVTKSALVDLDALMDQVTTTVICYYIDYNYYYFNYYYN